MIESVEISLREARSALENLLADRQTLTRIADAGELLCEAFAHQGCV